MLDATHAHADWAYLVAQAPLHPAGTEAARQDNLARLLQLLNQQRVRDVVLDTRANDAEQHQRLLEGRKTHRSDQPDLTTYRRLVRDGDISPRMRLIHVDDRRQPALWMADALAWAAQRALVYDEPQWWSRVTGITTVFDTTGAHLSLDSERAAPPAVNPAGDRDPRHQSPSAPAPLPRHYMLNGGTTNRTHGPGEHYKQLLDQAGGTDLQAARTRLSSQVAALSDHVAELTVAISQLAAAAAPALPATCGRVAPDPHTAEPSHRHAEPEPDVN
ncbi:hypothetical protein [Paractinoplanes globisporus]|uniref:Uncharacterized protein n=1 Tax=Paractinoplanes globisporus TaxID=113565 RepID=A0ABW6WGR5_9ACTN|nr:hypothetical protein [Actinoplanes globisporus]